MKNRHLCEMAALANYPSFYHTLKIVLVHRESKPNAVLWRMKSPRRTFLPF